MTNEPEVKTTETEDVTVESTNAAPVTTPEDTAPIKCATGHIHQVSRSRGVGRYRQRRTTFRLREHQGVQFAAWGRSSFSRREIPQDSLVVVRYKESFVLGRKYYNVVEQPEIVQEDAEVTPPATSMPMVAASTLAGPEIVELYADFCAEFVEFAKVTMRLLKISKKLVVQVRKEGLVHG